MAAGGFVAGWLYPEMASIRSARSVVQELVSSLHKVSCMVAVAKLSAKTKRV